MNFKHYIAAISIGLLVGSFHADAEENVLGNLAQSMSAEFKANKAKIASESNALKKQMAVDKNAKLSTSTEVLTGLIALEKKSDPSLPRFYVNCVKLTPELCKKENSCVAEGAACSRQNGSSAAVVSPAAVSPEVVSSSALPNVTVPTKIAASHAASPHVVAKLDENASPSVAAPTDDATPIDENASPNVAAPTDESALECPIGSNKRSRECADFDLTQPDVMDKANNTFDRFDDEGSAKKCARLKNDAAWLANCQALSPADCAKEGLCMIKEDKCGLNLDKVRALLQEREAKGWTKPSEVQFPCPQASQPAAKNSVAGLD